MERGGFRCLKSPSYPLPQQHGILENTSLITIWALRPPGNLSSLQESVPIKKWPYWAQPSLLWINLGGEGVRVGRRNNIEVLALNISELLKEQINSWKYLEIVSCLRKSSYMQKCHVNSKEIMPMADNERILLIFYCILIVFIAQNCILLPKIPCWRKCWKFLLKLILKL